MNSIKVLFLTRYTRMGPSSRYRFFQYFPYLEKNGFICDAHPLFDDAYLRNLYFRGRAGTDDFARALYRRSCSLLRVKRYDLVVLEKEVMPYLPSLPENILRLLRVPYIVDYDDAIFDKYRHINNAFLRGILKEKIAAVMRRARLVIAGNGYLADYARSSGAGRVEIIPTVVDLSRYQVAKDGSGGTFRICWIGTPSAVAYLKIVGPALMDVCRNGSARLVMIGANNLKIPGVPVDFLPWSEESEVADLSSCDVGIMPLADTPWEMGKCGVKLIQYMGCGLPVIASPTGANTLIVEDGKNGIIARSIDEWARALILLKENKALREEMGKAGRRKVEQMYCTDVTAPRMAELFRWSLNG